MLFEVQNSSAKACKSVDAEALKVTSSSFSTKDVVMVRVLLLKTVFEEVGVGKSRRRRGRRSWLRGLLRRLSLRDDMRERRGVGGDKAGCDEKKVRGRLWFVGNILFPSTHSEFWPGKFVVG